MFDHRKLTKLWNHRTMEQHKIAGTMEQHEIVGPMEQHEIVGATGGLLLLTKLNKQRAKQPEINQK